MLLRFHNDPVGLGVGKLHATVGVDIATVVDTPRAEGFRVDVSFDHEVSLSSITLADLFGLILPLQEGSGGAPVGEEGAKRFAVAFDAKKKYFLMKVEHG